MHLTALLQAGMIDQEDGIIIESDSTFFIYITVPPHPAEMSAG